MNVSRRKFLRVGCTALIASSIGAYSFWIEPHWLEIVYRELPIRKLPLDLVGKRLIQLSDLHMGRVDEDYLKQSFELVNQLHADIIVYTGDLTDHKFALGRDREKIFLDLPKGKLGTFGILGNHDYGLGWRYPKIASVVAAHAEAQGVVVLRNQIADLSGLKIVGLDDLWAGQFEPSKVLPKLDKDAASIVLSHNPDTADELVWGDYSGWILSGHTHGGQCKPPFLPPPLLPVKNRNYVSGKVLLNGGRRMYISRGIGHTLPIRFNVRPEVTVFTLVAA